MYKLTLTSPERQAIDWVGNRYVHGDDFYKLLCEAEWEPDDVAWSDEGDITFCIPEHVAWEMRVVDEDNFACFAPSLVEKLVTFLERIV